MLQMRSLQQDVTDSVVVLDALAWTPAPTSKATKQEHQDGGPKPTVKQSSFQQILFPSSHYTNANPSQRLLRVKVARNVVDSFMLQNRCLLVEEPSTKPASNAVPTRTFIAKYVMERSLDQGDTDMAKGGGTLQSDCFSVSDQAPKTTVIDTTSIKAKPGQGCPRCGGVVFAAEEVLAKGRQWHRKCFKCKDCTKTLDSINACDGPDSDVYCRTCYGKKWGPHGYGFACGSGFLQTDGLTDDEISASRPFYNPDTTSIKAPPGQGCPRCGGMVFAAEQQLAKGTMWHRKCFNCAECHRPLDSVLACDGPDKEVHCRACYGKLFGPKGFGFGHAPTLVCSDGAVAPAVHDPRPNSGPKAAPGKGCGRCGFSVFAAEQMISKNGIWHKRCFSCADCNRSLDSTILNDGPNGDIYCRGCYGRNFGPKGVGFGMGAGTLTMA
ncbi:hypothetical protein JTB14_021753 [Gonioctena quinquepunctata]|nr:hypothetical protein JTB14_021753 [Gonioctena quinquepunctata]